MTSFSRKPHLFQMAESVPNSFLIVTWLIEVTGSKLAPAFYVIAIGAASLVGILNLNYRTGREWKTFMKAQEIQRGLRNAGFRNIAPQRRVAQFCS